MTNTGIAATKDKTPARQSVRQAARVQQAAPAPVPEAARAPVPQAASVPQMHGNIYGNPMAANPYFGFGQFGNPYMAAGGMYGGMPVNVPLGNAYNPVDLQEPVTPAPPAKTKTTERQITFTIPASMTAQRRARFAKILRDIADALEDDDNAEDSSE